MMYPWATECARHCRYDRAVESYGRRIIGPAGITWRTLAITGKANYDESVISHRVAQLITVLITFWPSLTTFASSLQALHNATNFCGTLASQFSGMAVLAEWMTAIWIRATVDRTARDWFITLTTIPSGFVGSASATFSRHFRCFLSRWFVPPFARVTLFSSRLSIFVIKGAFTELVDDVRTFIVGLDDLLALRGHGERKRGGRFRFSRILGF